MKKRLSTFVELQKLKHYDCLIFMCVENVEQVGQKNRLFQKDPGVPKSL